MFVDIVFVGENLLEVNNIRLDEWRLAFEGKGLRMSKSKTVYIVYDH